MLADHLSPLTWQWRSQRTERQKTGMPGLFANAVTTFAVVMDASAQGENRRDAMFWMTLGNPGAGATPSRPTVEQVLAHMHRQHAAPASFAGNSVLLLLLRPD